MAHKVANREESCHTHGYVMSHNLTCKDNSNVTHISHVTHITTVCHTMSQIETSHVTRLTRHISMCDIM